MLGRFNIRVTNKAVVLDYCDNGAYISYRDHVRAMQEEIATLQAENAALQRKLVSARLANRPATDLSDVDFGAPHLRER